MSYKKLSVMSVKVKAGKEIILDLCDNSIYSK